MIRRSDIEEDLIELIRELPLELREEVKDFVEFLLVKHSKPKKRLKFDWFGGLEEFKNKYTSLELQKKALDWWSD